MPKLFQIIVRLIGKPPGKAAKGLAEIVINPNYLNGNFYNKSLKSIAMGKYSNDLKLQDKLYNFTKDLIHAKQKD